MAHAEKTTTTTATNSAANQDRKRVKVYELKNNDWYDRGTGFCSGTYATAPEPPEGPDAHIVVVSEEDADRTLLTTRIGKDDGYQKQQDTLIVWTEKDGVDMALSFQEAEGCGQIWEFVSEVQTQWAALGGGDDLSDDLLDPVAPMSLPDPQLGRLDEIENAIRSAASTPAGREALAKYVMHGEQQYILKLAPLVEMAEDLESTADLHRLCTIMKHLILLNDASIIEFVVTDAALMGVVGALEYDPDFPSHRANHRQWLSDTSRFKQVVPIENEEVVKKIHWTNRLLYLKDVVLARILDDPTFSVLNSLIFFHQVDVVNNLQNNPPWMKRLFDTFDAPDQENAEKKKDAVLFIQNCCAVSKQIQAASRAHLYNTFIHHGLFTVITFALRHKDAAVRVAGTDILVALIDHDPHMVRNHIFAAIREGHVPLTDILIELLLVEVDLGVKSQMADAIKILLDPTATQIGMDMMNRTGNLNSEAVSKQRGGGPVGPNGQQQQSESFVAKFYDSSARRMFAPLKALETRSSMSNLNIQETSLYTHLVDVLCFFVRQHSHASKSFILSEELHSRVAQLLQSSQKYMKLAALKWFRTCIGLQDTWHNRQMIQNHLFDPILRIVEDTMPRDNLLNSACLELFEYIKREGVKELIVHLVTSYRDRLIRMSYVNTFQALVLKYDQLMEGYPNGAEDSSFTTQEGTPQRIVNGRQGFAGLKEMDNDEEAYFNTEDDVDDDESLPTLAKQSLLNGASPVRPLVNYPDDDEADEEGMDILASSPDHFIKSKRSSNSGSNPSSDEQALSTDPLDPVDPEPMDEDTTSPTGAIKSEDQLDTTRGRDRTPVALHGSPGQQQSPPEPVAMKRRREDEDDDELGRMMGGVKRRNSSASLSGRTGNLGLTSQPDSPSEHAGGGPVLPSQLPSQIPSQAQLAGDTHKASLENGNTNGPTLRRKGSLKTKNESAASVGKFGIKAINLSNAAKQHVAPAEGEENQGGGGGEGVEEKKEEAEKAA